MSCWINFNTGFIEMFSHRKRYCVGTLILPYMILFIFFLLSSGCSDTPFKNSIMEFGTGSESDRQKFLGRIEPTGMTSYMYGSHVLVSEEGRYALEPFDGLDQSLGSFEGKRVRIIGRLRDGYPVDGGPPLINVREITVP